MLDNGKSWGGTILSKTLGEIRKGMLTSEGYDFQVQIFQVQRLDLSMFEEKQEDCDTRAK